MDGDQGGHAGPPDILAPNQVPRPLGSHHHDVDLRRWNDLPVVDVEPVGEQQGLPGLHGGRDVLGIDAGLGVIRGENLDHVAGLSRLPGGNRLKAILDGLLVVGGAWPLADDHFDSAVPQVLGLGVSLAAVPDDRHLPASERVGIRVRFIIHPHAKPP